MSGTPYVEQLNFDANEQVLDCTSINGPATDVTWRRNEVKLTTDEDMYRQSQTITNKSENRYVSHLYIRTRDPMDVAGNYSCTVSNLRGEDRQNLEIRGKGSAVSDLWHCHNSFNLQISE